MPKRYKSLHRHAIVTVVAILLQTIIPMSCQRTSKMTGASKADTINWKDSAKALHDLVNGYYNNNVHDSLVMMVHINKKLCSEHQLWHQYFQTWMKLGEEYVCTGEPDSAMAEAMMMHDEAISLDNEYGLMVADYINALVYDVQRNNQECARLLRQVLDKSKGMDEPHFRNKIYTNYINELKALKDYPTMRQTLKEWRQSLDSLVKYNTDTVKITPRNLMSFLYMYQRSCYGYYLIQKEYREAALAVDSIAYYNEKMGWTVVARNEVLHNRITLAEAQKNYEEALRLSDEQMRMSSESGYYTGILNALDLRQNILAGLGRWHEAYDCVLKWNKSRDSVRTMETSDRLNELNKRFELDEVKLQAERQQMQAEHRQLYMIFAIILLAVIGGTFFFFYRYRSAKRMAKMKAAQERIEGELKIARDIQMSMVPSTFPEYEGLDMYASMRPAREVGGDLYGYVINGAKLYFAVGDVSGKGVPASLFMAQATRLFHLMAMREWSLPSSVHA